MLPPIKRSVNTVPTRYVNYGGTSSRYQPVLEGLRLWASPGVSTMQLWAPEPRAGMEPVLYASYRRAVRVAQREYRRRFRDQMAIYKRYARDLDRVARQQFGKWVESDIQDARWMKVENP